jgi:hypothetical protein
MLKRLFLCTVLVTSLFASLAQSQTPFSMDSSASYLRKISAEIGARPMGSPNERMAMEFAVNKFREFGIHDTYLMPIANYPGVMGGIPTNTRSGVVVAVLRGTSDRIIVLGAHIDSADPEVPGANDDGSGSAVILELARVLSQRKNESTIVFALFGGEEAGLQGSRYFVEHFADIDRVALMLQVDMANGSPLLFPLVDASGRSTPEWLVRASYEEFAKLGHTGLHFPTDFFVFMGALPGGGVGSDHEPFLERNIPAIDFTSDVRDPIHTPQDNFENFKVSGLKRSGDLIYALFDRFDRGVPKETKGSYFLYQAGSYPFFVPIWALWGFIAISIAVGIFALFRVRQRREMHEGVPSPKIPGLKLFLLMLLIQACVWLSENVVSLVKGVRYPWMSDITGYYILAFFAACIGIWLALRLSPKLRLRQDAYTYTVRAFSLLFLFVAVALFSSAKFALYPATALFLLGLAMIVRNPILKLLFWLLSPHFMFRLFFTEGFDFLARFMHSQPEITPLVNSAVMALFVFFFSLWAFPFLLGFAAIHFDSKTDLFWLGALRKHATLIVILALFAGTALYLSQENSYSKEWKPCIRIEENFNLDSTNGSLALRSTEYLAGTRIRFVDHDTTVPSSTGITIRKAFSQPAHPWVMVTRSIQSKSSANMIAVDMVVHVTMVQRPIKLKLSYSTISGKLTNASSPYASGTTERSISLQWASFPDTSLTIPISFSLAASDSLNLREHMEASFVELPYRVSLEPRVPSAVINRSAFVRDGLVKLH